MRVMATTTWLDLTGDCTLASELLGVSSAVLMACGVTQQASKKCNAVTQNINNLKQGLRHNTTGSLLHCRV